MEKKKMEDNVIFIGKKPFMNYIFSSRMVFEKFPELIIKARGKTINRLVDVVEFLKRNENAKIKEMKLNSETIKQEAKDGRPERDVPVSTMDVILIK